MMVQHYIKLEEVKLQQNLILFFDFPNHNLTKLI